MQTEQKIISDFPKIPRVQKKQIVKFEFHKIAGRNIEKAAVIKISAQLWKQPKKTNQSNELWSHIQFTRQKTKTNDKCLTPNFYWTRPQAIKINSTCRRKILFNAGFWVWVTHLHKPHWIPKLTSSATAAWWGKLQGKL